MSQLSRFWLVLIMVVFLIGLMICPKFIESIFNDMRDFDTSYLYEHEY